MPGGVDEALGGDGVDPVVEKGQEDLLTLRHGECLDGRPQRLVADDRQTLIA